MGRDSIMFGAPSQCTRGRGEGNKRKTAATLSHWEVLGFHASERIWRVAGD
jgi:hypothetical protein